MNLMDRLRAQAAALASAGVTVEKGHVRFTDASVRRLGDLAYASIEMARSDAVASSLMAWSVEWARCGMPQVCPSAKLVASLMATSMGAEGCALVEPPWRAFAIVIPPGLLPVESAAGRSTDIRLAHALWADGTLRVLGTDEYLSAWSTSAEPVSAWAEEWSPGGAESSLPHQSDLDVSDTRMLTLLARLVLGVAATLSVPDTQRDVRAKERKARASNAAREARGEPTSWTYVLGGNVRVDVRSAVRDYVERGGSPPSVQSLVRGHWKRQPHGPELSLRKWIHVEPYWRGPEDAPIVAARRTI